MEEKQTYEVVVYKTNQDFNDRSGEIIDEGLIFIHEALNIATECLKENAVVKLQSSDREYIQIFSQNE